MAILIGETAMKVTLTEEEIKNTDWRKYLGEDWKLYSVVRGDGYFTLFYKCNKASRVLLKEVRIKQTG